MATSRPDTFIFKQYTPPISKPKSKLKQTSRPVSDKRLDISSVSTTLPAQHVLYDMDGFGLDDGGSRTPQGCWPDYTTFDDGVMEVATNNTAPSQTELPDNYPTDVTIEQSNRLLTCGPLTFGKEYLAYGEGGLVPRMEEAYPAITVTTDCPTLQNQQFPIAAASTSPTDCRPDHGGVFEGLQTPPGSSYIIRSMVEYQEEDHILTDENEKTDTSVIDPVTDVAPLMTPPRSDSNDEALRSKESSPSQVVRRNVRTSQSTKSTQSPRPHLSDNSLSDAPHVSSIGVADEQQEHHGLGVDATYQVVELTLSSIPIGSKIVVGKLQFDKPTTHPNILTLDPNLLGPRSQVVQMSKISPTLWWLIGYQHDDSAQEFYVHGNVGAVRSNTKDIVGSYPMEDTSGRHQSRKNEDDKNFSDYSEEDMDDRAWSKWEDKRLLSCMADGKKLSEMDSILDRSLGEIRKRWATIRQDGHGSREMTLTGTKTVKSGRVTKLAKSRGKKHCKICGRVGHNKQTCAG